MVTWAPLYYDAVSVWHEPEAQLLDLYVRFVAHTQIQKVNQVEDCDVNSI